MTENKPDVFDHIQSHFCCFYGGVWLWVMARLCILPWLGINIVSNSETDLCWSLITGFIMLINFWDDV
jgi:hypothetical protein